MGDGDSGAVSLPTPQEALAALMSRDENRSRVEPEIANNIGAQLEHMELDSLSLSMRRRIRDVVGRAKPRNVCEIGSGIGHLSAWLLDIWSSESHPEHYHLVEAGGKFGVILKRLVSRYKAEDWAHVTVGRFDELVAATESWNAANASNPAAGRPPLHIPFDLAIVDVGWKGKAEAVEQCLQVMADGGIILTEEPEVPIDDVGDLPLTGELTDAQSRVAEFNRWVAMVTTLNEGHLIGFAPLFGGTLVAIVK